jgi:hypothetical protein
MGADIHASIEYSDYLDEVTGEPKLVFTYADVELPRNYDAFGALGYEGRGDLKAAVPIRGWPKKADGFYAEVGWGFRREAAMLAVRKAKAGKDGFDERGYKEEGDGTVCTWERGEEWVSRGCKWLDRDLRDQSSNAEYRYVSDPDIHTVNWITSAELQAAILLVERYYRSMYKMQHPRLHEYRAALAAMKELEKDPRRKMVRFIYGFDN